MAPARSGPSSARRAASGEIRHRATRSPRRTSPRLAARRRACSRAPP